MSERFTLRTDGGARGNPGPSGAGFVLENSHGEVVRRGGKFLGATTNNVAEYEALVWGLRTALEHGVRQLRVVADSELVVRQCTGVYKVKNEGLKPLHARVCALMRRFDSVDVTHVRRAENEAADALANEAMDLRDTVGDGAGDDVERQGSLF